MPSEQQPIRGRGAASNPPNRFELIHYERDSTASEEDSPSPATRFYRDHSRSILAHNDSPDVGFETSINPYRGCEHACSYCYARPTHEYLGFSAGLDFETRIMVKEDAPVLLRKELASAKWRPRLVAISGVTDPYQPIERRLGLTRRCLEVFAEFRNPVGVVTKIRSDDPYLLYHFYLRQISIPILYGLSRSTVAELRSGQVFFRRLPLGIIP